MPRNWKMRNRGGCQAIRTSQRLSSVSYLSCIYEFFRCVNCQRRSLGICFNTRHQFIEEACPATSSCRLVSSSVTKKRKRYQQRRVTSCKASNFLFALPFATNDRQNYNLTYLTIFCQLPQRIETRKLHRGRMMPRRYGGCNLFQRATRIHGKRPGQGALGGRWCSICRVSVGRCNQKCKWKVPRDLSSRLHLCQSLSGELN